ncbi:MAG: LLM class flavin-dependent oxidoreductase [Chloroflexi bacterium]|nr:LLM class flavin-dependent oxidoreductase [Chloroflexota bacterium]
MQFGVLQFFSWPERRVALETVYERALERIAIMDQTGYDAVWLAEHHFSSFSVCPSVHIMGTYVAARTKNLRIGTAVSLAAMYHPLRLAEEVALLDVLSGGRVNWGAGRGFDPTEFRAFGVEPEESASRFRENVEIVLQAWTQDRITYHGSHYDFEGVEVLPKPLQRPTPPVWVAATSPPAMEWAAEQGHTILMDPHSSHAEIGRKREQYRQTLEAHGHSIEGRTIPVARLLALAETHEAAVEVARAGARGRVGSYGAPLKKALGVSGETHEVDRVEHYVNDVILVGTPDEVVDQLTELQEEISLDYLLCAPLSHETFLLLTERVLPRLAS